MTTARLPTVGGDDEQWGSILNSFLEVAHNADGTLSLAAIQASGGYAKPTGGIPAQDLSQAVQTSLSPIITANDQSGAYVAALSDAGQSIDVTSVSATTVTIPPNSNVAFPVGTVIEVAQLGAGQVQIVAGGGVTINSPGSLVHTRTQYSAVSLRKLSTNAWILSGDLA